MEIKQSDNSYNHILKYTSLFGGTEMLNILVALLRNKLVALLLGPAGMGLMSLYNSTVKLVSDSTNLGLSMSGVKRISEELHSGDERRVHHSVLLVRSLSQLTAVLGMAVCIVFAPLLSRWMFQDGGHSLSIILLSPIVGLTAITGGELALLKGTGQLRDLAAISVLNVVAALFTTVPLYYFFGEAGIIPSLLVIAATKMLLTVRRSWQLIPFRVSLSPRLLRSGKGMLVLGAAFVVAGIMGSGSDFLVRSFLSHGASLDMVGWYNAGYIVVMSYGGVVFSSMETDYFPRLSAVGADRRALSAVVNRQIEVSLLIIAPLTVLLIVGMPLLLPLLYSSRFLPALAMMQIMSLGLYLRAIKLPLAYIALARGDSKAYMTLEGIYDVLFVGFVIAGFLLGGLAGIGWAIALLSVIDFFVLLIFTSWRFGYRISSTAIRYICLQLPWGFVALAAILLLQGPVRWGVGFLMFVVSAAISLRIFRSKTSVYHNMLNKLKHKLWRR